MRVQLKDSVYLAPKLAMTGIPVPIGILASTKEWLWVIVLTLIALIAVAVDWLLGELKPWLRRDIHVALRVFHKLHGWDDNTRVCLYVPATFGNRLKQATRYAPTEKYGSGRKGVHEAKGIIGKTYRTGDAHIELLGSADQFEQSMKDKWGFTDKDLGRISRDRRSYLCVPILGTDTKARAVLFADSSKTGFFTDKDKESLLTVATEVATLL